MLRSVAFASFLTLAFSGHSAQSAKTKKKKTTRAPASAPLVVHSEYTSFEEMLAKRELMARKPAAFQIKARVIGIRRDIGLTDKEDDNAPRDIVLNAGSNSGISRGMKMSVKRHIPILDPYRENVQRTLEVEFAKVEILHVQDELAIARIQSVDDIDEGLAVGVRSVILGDYVGMN